MQKRPLGTLGWAEELWDVVLAQAESKTDFYNLNTTHSKYTQD